MTSDSSGWPSDAFPFKRILLFARSEHRGAQVSLIRFLKERFQASIWVVCANADQEKYYNDACAGMFEAVLRTDFYYQSLDEPLDSGDVPDLQRRARGVEQKYGWPLIQIIGNDRHVGLGLSPGGINLTKSSYAAKSSYWKAVRMQVRMFDFVEAAMHENSIDLVLYGNFVCSIVCQGRNTPYFILDSSGYKNFWYWSPSYLLDAPHLHVMYRRSQELGRKAEPFEQAVSPAYYVKNRAVFRKRLSFIGCVRGMAYEVARRAWHILRRYNKRKGYFLLEKIRERWSVYRQYRDLMSFQPAGIEELKSRPYIFFPLGSEPERILTGRSPEFTNQYQAVLSIAQRLPTGHCVAVKEHFSGLGNRPRDYYKGLSAIPNVVLVDPSVPGVDAIKHAEAVATITGTAGTEAASMGVPVLSFARRNPFNFLPHVFEIDGGTDLDCALAAIGTDAARTQAKLDREKTKLDGGRYHAALREISVDLGDKSVADRLPESTCAALVDAMLQTGVTLQASEAA